jgi:hypothetical protein
MIPADGELLHFSEDPSIEVFVPHVAATARQPQAYVWAVDAQRAPDYWFPRQCPRAMAWATAGTTGPDRDLILGPGGGDRVHAVEYGWLERIRTVQLFAYPLPASAFTPFGDRAHAYVSTAPVRPLGPPLPVGDLLHLHDAAGIQLRVLSNLWPFWDTVTRTTLGFSAIRMGNARPRSAAENA